MTNDDALFRFRLRVMAAAREMGNVRAACRLFGIHHSTFYRWRGQMVRHGNTEMLRPRERRAPRMPNAFSPLIEGRILAYALAFPGQGPDRIAAELTREKWGGLRLSPNGVWRVLRRHGLNTRAARLALVAGYAAPPSSTPAEPPPERHIDAERPGQVVQMDCLCVGRLSGTKGTVWQYTAIDVASAYTWAELHATDRNPLAQFTSALARRVARDLAARGWRLETVITDNASEFRAKEFTATLERLGADHRPIRAERPQSNGCVERVQLTILDECWKPAFARYLIPKMTGLAKTSRSSCTTTTATEPTPAGSPAGAPRDHVLGKTKMFGPCS